MMLRRIEIKNWRCIRELVLDDLPDGVSVLHGPNQTGKSSVVSAIRHCLFDADHDASGKEFTRNSSWGLNEPPRVSVEFFAGGRDYRVTKVFSKRKEGTARLETRAAGRWTIEPHAPKEVSRRVREILGAEKSTEGMNQLLWLAQGDVALPAPGKLDATLEEQLVGVLGAMVTGRDVRFVQRLQELAAVWWTKTWQVVKASPLAALNAQVLERSKRRDEERANLERCERTIQRLHECEDALPRTTAESKAAAEEVAQLQRERERCRERLQKFRDAERDVRDAESATAHTEERMKTLLGIQSRRESEIERLAKATNCVATGTRQRDAHAAELDKSQTASNTARDAVFAHHNNRDEISARQALLNLARDRDEITRVVESVEECRGEIAELERRLGAAAAPDKKTLDQLRTQQRQAQTMRAELQAAAMHLSLTLEQPSAVHAVIDGEAMPDAECAAGSETVWIARQYARLELPGVCAFTVGRGRKDVDLEESARELAKIERAFADAVRGFGENPADDACLDRLAEAQLERAGWSNQLKERQAKLQKLCPEGHDALCAQLAKCVQDCQVIHERRPELEEWTPRQEDVDLLERRFNDRASELENARRASETAEATARASYEKADKDLSKLQADLVAARTAENAAREELERAGDHSTLAKALETCRAALESARRTLAESELTEDERTIDKRLGDAKTAADARAARLHDFEKEIENHRGELRGNEGLHTRLADAETALAEAESARARQQIDADAHKLLCELFEQARDTHVQAVMTPIAGRVLDWSREIGLKNLQEVRFGDRFLPEGLTVPAATGDAAVAIDIGAESYGAAEQISLLVRLALGGILARDEPATAIFDDPLAHADAARHRRILDVLRIAAEGGAHWSPPAGKLQILILTCHPDRFDHLAGARHIDLAKQIRRV